MSAIAVSGAARTVNDSLTTFGRVFAELTDGRQRSQIGQFSINGVDVKYMTASTPLSIKEALDRVQRMCTEHGGLESSSAIFKPMPTHVEPQTASLLHGVYRENGEREGVIACLHTGAPLGVAELVRRLQRFSQTGDLSAVGQFRYALMRRERESTSALVLWSEAETPLLRMFPHAGDAPGVDPGSIPRPVRSTRLFTATLQGSPYGIAVYRVLGRTPSVTCGWYVEELVRASWHTKLIGADSIVAHRDGQTVVIRVMGENSADTIVSVAQLA